MATSGTTAFDLNVDELIEEAFERCGLELRTGYDLETARRSLNLMFADWSNRGLNLWVIEERTESLTEGTASYDLDVDLVNVLSAVIRTTSGSTTKPLSEHVYPALDWVDTKSRSIAELGQELRRASPRVRGGHLGS